MSFLRSSVSQSEGEYFISKFPSCLIQYLSESLELDLLCQESQPEEDVFVSSSFRLYVDEKWMAV